MADDKGAQAPTDAPAPDAKPAPAADAPPPADKPAAPEPHAQGTAAAKPDAPVAPETYALAIPQGSEDFLDQDDLATVTTLAKANKWTNAQAQAFIEQEATRLQAQTLAFRAETEAHPVYGGDHLITTEKHARLVLERFAPAGTPEGDAIRRDLVKSGYGNKVSVVSFLARIGKTMAEDSPAQGSGGGAKRDAAEVLYGGPTV